MHRIAKAGIFRLSELTPFAFREIQLAPGGHGRPRTVTAFLPPGFNARDGSHPVVYCADGGAVAAFGLGLARAIQSRPFPAAILIGVHSSPEARAEEYLPGVDRERFDAHAEFFTHQVADWACSEFGVSKDPRSCAVFGVSNGGAFAVAIGCRHPERFGHVIAFSVAKSSERVTLAAPLPERFPRFYLAAGNVGPEIAFRRNTAALARMLQRRGVECAYHERADAGHEIGFWQQEFVLGVSWAFPASRAMKDPGP